MYIVAWESKRTGELCEFATREEETAQELHALLVAHEFKASCEAEVEEDYSRRFAELDSQADPFNPGYDMAGRPLTAA